MLVASWKYFFTWNTQNIIWEKFKSLEYLLNMSLPFVNILYLIKMFSFYLSLFRFPFS